MSDLTLEYKYYYVIALFDNNNYTRVSRRFKNINKAIEYKKLCLEDDAGMFDKYPGEFKIVEEDLRILDDNQINNYLIKHLENI